MSNDLNNCNFIGRLGKEPETRFMPNGEQVTSFILAVGNQWKDRGGEKKESTEWVNCSSFGKLAEVVSQYLTKGSQVFISGRLKTDKYQAKDGSDRYATKIIVDRIQMLGSKTSGQREEPQSQPQEQKKYDGGSVSSNFDDLDSDIPF